MRFEPIFQLAIALHPTPPRVQNEDRQAQGPAPQQVAFDELFPFLRDMFGNFCETIPRKIDKAETFIELEEIDRLRTARPGTCVGQPVGSYQRINQTGFANVTASQKRDFRLSFRRKLLRLGCTYYKPC